MNSEIVESFSQMVREKGIDKDILVGIVEDVFSMMVRKRYGQDAKFDVVVNMEKGDIEIFLERAVVATVENPTTQISVEEARRLSGEELEVGEDYVEVIPLESFGRRLVVSAKQNLNQRIKEIEREQVYNEYSSAVGDIIVGEIYQTRRNEVLISHNRNELLLPRSEQIAKEHYKKGDTIRAVVKEVRKNSGSPVVVVSRADPKFLSKLFEMEIPEIYDGIIEIKRIAREPGERAKVAVESHDDRTDAVGACVGMKGVRIHTIVRELNNENIDVINYSDQPETFIARALAPAKLKAIDLNREAHSANVLVAADQVSLAIGRNGQNIRLASKLTGFELNLVKEGGEDEYDIDLDEFQDELGAELIGQMAEVGLKSARDVLEATMDRMLSVSGMTQDRVEEVREILRKELEEAEVEDESGEGEEEDEEEEEEQADPATAVAGEAPVPPGDDTPAQGPSGEHSDPATAVAGEAPVPPGDDTPAQGPSGEQAGPEAHGEDAGQEGR